MRDALAPRSGRHRPARVPTRARRFGIVAVLACCALVAAACGNGDDAASDDTTTTTDPSDGTVVIGTVETSYGTVLTDTDGQVLYITTEDEGHDTPTCTGPCAQEWPPVLAENIEFHGNLDLVANLVEREDGSQQVTINDRPVYTLTGEEPGEANGQGAEGVWWVLDVDGDPIRDDATPAGGETPGGGGQTTTTYQGTATTYETTTTLAPTTTQAPPTSPPPGPEPDPGY